MIQYQKIIESLVNNKNNNNNIKNEKIETESNIKNEYNINQNDNDSKNDNDNTEHGLNLIELKSQLKELMPALDKYVFKFKGPTRMWSEKASNTEKLRKSEEKRNIPKNIIASFTQYIFEPLIRKPVSVTFDNKYINNIKESIYNNNNSTNIEEIKDKNIKAKFQ